MAQSHRVRFTGTSSRWSRILLSIDWFITIFPTRWLILSRAKYNTRTSLLRWCYQPWRISLLMKILAVLVAKSDCSLDTPLNNRIKGQTLQQWEEMCICMRLLACMCVHAYVSVIASTACNNYMLLSLEALARILCKHTRKRDNIQACGCLIHN